MKKILYFTFVVALMVSACKKSEDEVVDPTNNNNNNNNSDTTTVQKPPFIAGNWNPFNGDTNFYSVDRDVRCFAVYNNDLYIGGEFSNVYDFKTWTGGSTYGLPQIVAGTKGIVKWNKANGFTKMPFEININPRINGMTIKDNKLYFVGNIYNANGNPAKGVFSWDGSSVTNYNPTNNTINFIQTSSAITSIASFNNKIYVPSFYYSSNGSGSKHLLASFDGTSWATDGGTSPHTQSQMLLCVYNNALYIAFGYEGKLYKYDGTILTKIMEVKADGTTGNIQSMYVYKNELYIGGWFYSIETANKTTVSANSIAKFNNSSWTSLANGAKDAKIHAITEWDGKLILGGGNIAQVNNDFYVANIVAWDGEKYLSIGEPKSKTNGNGVNGYVYALTSYNNELYAGGNFNRIADKNGITRIAYNLVRFTKTSK